jgi:hypothetical protein
LNPETEENDIGIGAWAIGGGKREFAWSAQNDSQSGAKTVNLYEELP